MEYLLAADIGTTSLKAVLFDTQLKRVASARVEYPTDYPASGYAEQNPQAWYSAFCQCCKKIIAQSTISADRIAAIGIDGMSSLALPVGRGGNPIYPGMIWLDRRASKEADSISRIPELQEISGNRSDASNFGPKVMWLRDNLPDIYANSSLILHCNSYLVFKLTGSFVMDRSQAGLSQLCEITSGEYSSTLLAATEIDEAKLPPIADCTDIVGMVTSSAAKDCGLVAGTPVIAGAMDNVAATVGLGLWQEGDAYISAGTATNVGSLTLSPPRNSNGLIYHYGSADRWLVNGGVDYGAAGLHWFRNFLEEQSFDRLNTMACQSLPTDLPLLFLPFMTGQRAPIWNEDTTGCLLGLTPQTEQRHVVRALMEGTGLGARMAFSQLLGELPAKAKVTGGITQSSVWMQTLADCMGIPVRQADKEDSTTLGTAIMTGVGCGVFSSFPDAFQLLPKCEHLSPTPAKREYYDRLYHIFTSTHESLQACYSDLAKLHALQGASQ